MSPPGLAPHYRVVLAKKDFKFSAAHFTIFGNTEAELLHGHNYRVEVEVSGPSLDELGLLVEFDDLKRRIRAACAAFDSRTLVPERSPYLEVERDDSEVELIFGRRRYRLPANDVVFIPVSNTTVELLANLLWEELAPSLDTSRIDRLAVVVEETDGQSCRFEAPLLAD